MDNSFTTQRNVAFITGFALLFMAVLAGYGYGYAFGSIYVPNDHMKTLTNLHQAQGLFRSFIYSFLLVLVLDVVVAWGLYVFFRQVDEALSLLVAWFRLAYCGVFGVSFVCLLFALELLPYVPQEATMVMISLKTFLSMWSLGLIVFGVHLFLLAILLYKAGVPKIWSVFMLLASLAYAGIHTASLLFAEFAPYKSTAEGIFALPMAVGELGLACWLIFRGGKKKTA